MREALELAKAPNARTYSSIEELREDLENDIALETDDEDETD